MDDVWNESASIERYLTSNHIFALQEEVRNRLERRYEGGLTGLETDIDELNLDPNIQQMLKEIIHGNQHQYLQYIK